MIDISSRFFRSEDGLVYRASFMHAGHGLDPSVKIVAFETMDGRRVGAAPIRCSVATSELYHEDLRELLKLAQQPK